MLDRAWEPLATFRLSTNRKSSLSLTAQGPGCDPVGSLWRLRPAVMVRLGESIEAGRSGAYGFAPGGRGLLARATDVLRDCVVDVGGVSRTTSPIGGGHTARRSAPAFYSGRRGSFRTRDDRLSFMDGSDSGAGAGWKS